MILRQIIPKLRRKTPARLLATLNVLTKMPSRPQYQQCSTVVFNTKTSPLHRLPYRLWTKWRPQLAQLGVQSLRSISLPGYNHRSKWQGGLLFACQPRQRPAGFLWSLPHIACDTALLIPSVLCQHIMSWGNAARFVCRCALHLRHPVARHFRQQTVPEEIG